MVLRGRSALLTLLLAIGPSLEAAPRPGVPPDDPWTCPASHPIKGYVSSEPGRRVYFVPGGPFYAEASPERCYASEDEARRDGSRPADGPQPLPRSRDLASRPAVAHERRGGSGARRVPSRVSSGP